MYLVDTDVISELRRGARADAGVRRFFEAAGKQGDTVYVSAITIGELQRGVELIRHRGDKAQAQRLEAWLTGILTDYAEYVLDFAVEEAIVWGKLRVPNHENALDKQIAAIALTRGLKLVTRNVMHFRGLGVEVINPFAAG